MQRKTILGLMMLFVFVGMPLGRWTLYLSHISFNVPYVTLSVMTFPAILHATDSVWSGLAGF